MARAPRREGGTRSKWRNPFRRRSKIAPEEAADAVDAQSAPTGVAALLRPVPHADRFTMQDLVAEATADIGARPGRLIMTTLGTVLGIGALVATIGFAETTAGQIASQFDAVAQTTVQVTPAKARTGGETTAAAGRIPWDAPERVMTLVGVEGAALISDVNLGSEPITAVPIVDPSAPQKAPPSLVAASGDVLATLHATITSGRMFDAGHDQRADRVAVLGAGAAESLGVLRIDRQPAIFISGIPYAVIGIVDDFQRRSDLRDAVIIPSQSASADFRLGAPSELQIRIAVGAGQQVAKQAPLVLAPNAPETLEAAAPPSRSSLASNVQADVNFVFLILGGIVLLAGALGIANVTLLNVMERVGEIGLRRAVGATRRQIATQFMVESVIIGLLGGLIGASVGVFAIVIVSLTQGWTPVVQPWVAIGGALLGAVVGWLAGAYPAGRAARIEPVAALRGS
jgi:putative ABC transport system permease protein